MKRLETMPADPHPRLPGEAAPARSADARPGWRELALALGFFAAATLAFLWPALARVDEASYTSADLLQGYALTAVGAPIRPGNMQLSDPVVEMLPWLEFNRSELREGRLPTWNPWNGAGLPHLANYQSAVFSPFSLPFYFAPLKWALLISAFLKLTALGAFTFLFVRALGIGFGAACAAGTIFEFGGHNVLLLAYPHSSVAVGFPAALWLVERAWQAWETDPESWTRRLTPWACGLAAAVAAMLFAGNPEPAAFAIAVSGLYALARGFVAWRRHPARFKACLGVLFSLGLACALGFSIAAVQVLPFFEYVARSTLIESRSVGFAGLRSDNWPLQFFPDLFGNPSQRYAPRANLPAPNYEAANTAYFGPLCWLFAAVATCLFFRRSPVRIFALLMLAWILCAFDFEWMRPLMVAFTELTRAPVNRSQFVPLLALAVLAAIAIDGLGPGAGRARWIRLAAICASAGAALWLAHRGADQLVLESFPRGVPPGQAIWVPPHLRFMSWTFAGGTLAFALLALVRGRRIRGLLVFAIVALVFAQTGWLLRAHNSLSLDEHVFPRTPAIDTIATATGNERLQVIGEDTLPPHTNMAYGIASIAVYDALWVGAYDRLYRTFFGSEGNWRETLWTTPHALETLGVRYLLARDGWPRVDPGIAVDPVHFAPQPKALPLQPGTEISQTFRAQFDGLDRVLVALGAQDDPSPAFAELILEDADSGEAIASRRLDTHSLRGGLTKKTRTLFLHDLRFSAPTGWIQLACDPQAHSGGKTYRLRLRAEAGEWKHGFIAWTVEDEAPDQRELRAGDAKLERRLCMDWAANVGRDLEPLATFDPFTLYRYRRSPGRFWIASEARLAGDAESAFRMTVARDHDPKSVVVLEGVEAGNLRNLGELSGASPPRVIEETTRRIALQVDVPRDAWMVAALSWYPGWKARVDGVPVALARANYAFLGVPVPSGAHRVELEFESGTVRIGAWISLAALTALVLAALRSGRARV